MKAYYKDGFEDITSWVSSIDTLFQHYDDLYDLGYQMVAYQQPMDKLYENGVADQAITHELLDTPKLIRVNLRSGLGQVITDYLDIKGVPLPPQAIIKGDALYFASDDPDWLPLLIGESDTDKLDEFAAKTGVTMVYGEE